VDGVTVAEAEQLIGVPGLLEDLRTSLKQGLFRPVPVRERRNPEPGESGKLRRLGIPTIANRVRKVLRMRWVLCRPRHNVHYVDLGIIPIRLVKPLVVAAWVGGGKVSIIRLG
jgi:hypothetical protein